jgi:hypothetical protein
VHQADILHPGVTIKTLRAGANRAGEGFTAAALGGEEVGLAGQLGSTSLGELAAAAARARRAGGLPPAVPSLPQTKG